MITGFVIPKSVDEAIDEFKARDDAFWYSGGTAINYAASPAKTGVAISLSDLNLSEVLRDGDSIRIGSTVTLQNLVDSPDVPRILQNAAREVAVRNIRNIATIGGNVAVNAEDSALVPVLIAWDAKVHCASSQEMPLEDYLAGNTEDLILAISITSSANCSYRRIARNRSTRPLAAVAVSLLPEPRIIISGVDGPSRRLKALEERLSSGIPGDQELAEIIPGYLNPIEDYRCSIEYKRYIVAVSLIDCIKECQEEVS